MRALVPLLLLIGCAESSEPHLPQRPAQVTHPIKESDLSVVRLSARAVERLQVQTTTVASGVVHDVRLVAGEVIVPPGRTLNVSAPVGGLLRAGKESLMPGARVERGDVLVQIVPLAPIDRDLLARTERELQTARAQLTAAESRVQRLRLLGEEKAASARSLEEASAVRDVALADMQAAERRAQTTQKTPLLADVVLTVRAPASGIVRTLSAVAGQAVASGAALIEIVAADALQVRVPTYSGDLARLDGLAPVLVHALAHEDTHAEGVPVAGPPTADPAALTVDRYYALTAGARFVPGQRVLVELPFQTSVSMRQVPAVAIVRDAEGAAWIYACAGERAFRRQRIDPIRTVAGNVLFERGPATGSCVAAQGASELFGSEFEPGH